MLKRDRNKKNVFLKCILTNNLGDDLLISSLCARYKDINFITLNCSKKSKLMLHNLSYINFNLFFYRVFRKICSLFKVRCLIDTFFINKCDYTVTIGGSLFMEQNNNDELFNWYNKLSDYCIIGSNIGPVYTDTYITSLKNKVFKNADFVCLRDKKSYNYVDDLTNVNFATDIVFSLDVNKYESVPKEKKVVFSLINVDKKSSQMKYPDSDGYINLICSLISKFYKDGYKIQLMSFCSDEGDEETINQISNMFPDICVDKFFYNGNIEEALENLASSEIIVGTRFHANILGLLMNKKIIPIAYNDKTINFLNDIDFNGSIIDINNLNEFKIDDLKYSTNKIDINKLKNCANKHFCKLDEMFIGSKSKYE